MIITANFLQNCMCWLTEISVYTSRINKMRKQVQAFKFKMSTGGVNEKYASTMLSIQTTSGKLNNIERSIIHTIRENSSHLNFALPTETRLAIKSEEDLYENMKYGYYLFIELQRSFNGCLGEDLATKRTPKIIEMQSIRRRQDTKTQPNHSCS